MKIIKTVLTLLFFLSLTSCKIQELIQENNDSIQGMSNSIDSLNIKVQNFSKNIESPELNNLRQISYSEFYRGNIKNESIKRINSNWKKISLKKSIQSGQEEIETESTGFINFNYPEIIFLIDVKQTEFKVSSKQLFNKSIESYSGNKGFVTERDDIYSQKELDIMIANGSYTFDGFKFNDKKFDFLDYNKGSFRGTIFNNCNLDNSINKKTSLNENILDFDQTQFILGIQEKLHFEYTIFSNSYFTKLTIKDSEFTNTLIDETNFNEVKFENTIFQNKEDGFINEISSMKSEFYGTRFIDTKIYSSRLWANYFEGCTFKNFDIKWTGFTSYGNNKTKFNLCNFYNGRFFSGSQKDMIIENDYGWSEFSNVDFIFPQWNNSRIKAWFKDGCLFDGGSNADLSNVNWLTSIFTETQFGVLNDFSKVNMTNNKFDNVDFRPGVVFNDCDFTGSTWPDLNELQNAGVKFYDCTEAPYNN